MKGSITVRRLGVVGLAAAVALVGAACGSDDSNDAASSAADAGSSVAAAASSAVAEASSAAESAVSAAESSVAAATSDAGAAASSVEEAASSDAAAAGDPFATPDAATGDPVLFGLLSVESGPVVFPEVRAGIEAAVKYINEYRGGINGHPIQLEICATDGQPATSARCATQVLDKKPVAIMGGADFGSPGAMEVYGRAGLAYLGGVPFTPVEQNVPNAVIFSSISIGDNGAATKYAVEDLGVKKLAVIYADAPPGQASAAVIENVGKNAGAEVKLIPIPETAADASSYAAAAIAESPDAIYIDSPSACAAIGKSLKDLGYTGKLLGIDTCTDPRVIEAAAGGVDGLYFAAPLVAADSGEPDADLFVAAMQKYAPADTTMNSLTAIGFQTAMNVEAALDDTDPATLDMAGILDQFKTPDTPNFMGHPYTCDGKQLNGATAICNAYQQIRQIQGDKIVPVSTDWITVGDLYTPAPPA